MRLHIGAIWQLLRLEYYVLRGNFKALYHMVRSYPCSDMDVSADSIERICHAIDVICIWYPKHVLCLQRSAATACLLRRSGVPAKMVIGAQTLPFKAHAWVEIEGRVVNDKDYTPDMYAVLDRC